MARVMYKDVKKKLLSVVLCVCMVIGAVQVVPRAKAAATGNGDYYEITAGYNRTGGSETLRVKVSGSTTLTYKGSAYAPEVTEVLDQNGKDVTSQFETKLDCTGDTTNTGSFYGVLVPSSNSKYTVNKTLESNQIEFTIDQASISRLIINSGALPGENPV